MAKISQRLWKIPGQRTKRKAWGFTARINGKQVRRYKAEWTKDDAEAELAKALLKIEPAKPKSVGITLDQAIERYLAAKSRKRSVSEDRRILGHLKNYFGKDAPLAEITASRISEYKGHRLSTVRKIGEGETAFERPLAGATVNRPLALLRHLLRLAHEEWELLDAVPRIRMEREAEGRLRWLTPEEATRLLDACGKSRNEHLTDLVEFALFTGLRRGEVLGLTWERLDRARGVKLADFRFHDLRHTSASWAVQRGASLQEVKDLLGHNSLAMTLRYGHLAPEHLRTAVARLDAALPTKALAQDLAQEGVTEGALLSK